jgi:hypothetical protein
LSEEKLKIDPYDPEALEHEREEAERLQENSGYWAGIYTAQVSWRELHSSSFTNDFFGLTESRAILRTLYDRICRSALGRLKSLGYDISDYQDDSGKLTISTERIDQLVVGERVYVDPTNRQPAPAAEGGEKKVEAKA